MNNSFLYGLLLCILFASCTDCTIYEKKGEFTLRQETIDAFPFISDPSIVATPDTFIYSSQDSNKIYVTGNISGPIKRPFYFKSYPDPGECDSIKEYVQTETINLNLRSEYGRVRINHDLTTGIEPSSDVNNLAVFEQIAVRVIVDDVVKKYDFEFDIILDEIQNEISTEYRVNQLNEATLIQDTIIQGKFYESLYSAKDKDIEVFYALDKGLVYIEFENGDYWNLD